MNKPTVAVIFGDISKTRADALITAINSSGIWFGSIDGVIQRVAGDLFHSQAADALPATDGEAIVTHSKGHFTGGAFANVVFVIDDLGQALRNVIYAGLKAASNAGFKTVTLPTIRMGVMSGVIEKSAEEAVNEMSIGVSKFIEDNPGTSISNITFVVYNDPKTCRMLKEAFPA